jgi:hypothetical protein
MLNMMLVGIKERRIYELGRSNPGMIFHQFAMVQQ